MIITRTVAAKLTAFALAGAVAGVGTLALAPSNAVDHGSPAASGHHRGKLKAERAFVRHIQHAQWTTRNGKDHAAIRGTVKALTATTVTISSKDGTTQTWRVTGDTRVRVLGDHHRGLDKFSEVEVGDRALAAGTDAQHARHLLAAAPRAATTGAAG